MVTIDHGQLTVLAPNRFITVVASVGGENLGFTKWNRLRIRTYIPCSSGKDSFGPRTRSVAQQERADVWSTPLYLTNNGRETNDPKVYSIASWKRHFYPKPSGKMVINNKLQQ
ncbi:uncharacterized protein [Euwallacea fornicatus]|uniref:uncharacterized protein isoform X2 n=1 Tax=Euwallacea fornicatus TaxID=995702 RepID=UPI00338F6E3F